MGPSSPGLRHTHRVLFPACLLQPLTARDGSWRGSQRVPPPWIAVVEVARTSGSCAGS